MNSKFIQKYCKANKITIAYKTDYCIFEVLDKNNNIMYHSHNYNKCLEYITEVIINDKHSSNR